MNNLVSFIVLKNIACAYVMYINDRTANDVDDIISFEQYLDMFGLCLIVNKVEIEELTSNVLSKIKEEKKQAKKEKKRCKKNKKIYPFMGDNFYIDEQEVDK